MTDATSGATLSTADTTLDLDLVTATEGNGGYDISALLKETDATVRAAQKEAEKLGVLSEQGRENIGSMFEDVYAELPAHLAEQRDAALREAQ